MANIKSEYWVDVNSALRLNGKPVLLYGLDAINNSIYNILRCPLGTRGWRPDYGSELPMLLWEPVDDITASRIASGIPPSIKKWEPRVTLITQLSNVQVNSLGDGYDIRLAYEEVKTGIKNIAVFSFARL